MRLLVGAVALLAIYAGVAALWVAAAAVYVVPIWVAWHFIVKYW